MSCLIRNPVLLALPLALLGCAPINPTLIVDDVQVGNRASATFGISANTASIIGSSLLITGPVDPNQAVNHLPLNDPASPADLGLLPPGRYLGNVTWTYKRLFSGTPETINASTADFQVLEPNGCFSFNFSAPPAGATSWTPGTQGWAASQFYVGDTNVLASLSAVPAIYPYADQLRMVVHPNALRTPSTVPLWRTDVQSPSLENNPGWQNAQGIRYWIRADRYSNLNLQVQSILHVRKADGSTALFAEGTQTTRIFHPIAQWTQVVSPIPLPPGAKILGASVRIFGLLPLPAGPDIVFTLDDICPVP